MKPCFLLFYLLLAAGWTEAQSLEWQWVVPGGGGVASRPPVSATDAAGNVYVAGSFTDSLTWGGITIRTASFGDQDGFVARFTPAGQCEWVARIGGAGMPELRAIAVDDTGRVYVAGQLNSNAATFGSLTVNTNQAGSWVFVAALNRHGRWAWVRQPRGGFEGTGLALDHHGHVLVCGHFFDAMTFGATRLPKPTRGSGTFIAQLTPAGQWGRAVAVVSPHGVHVAGLATDTSGATYVGGGFLGELRFDTLTLATDTLTPRGFIARLSPAGRWEWARQVTDAAWPRPAYVHYLAAAADGSVYVAGEYSAPVLIGTTPLPADSIYDNVFVARLTPEGQWGWATSVRTRGPDYSNGLVLDGKGHVVVSVLTSGPPVFGAGVPGPFVASEFLNTTFIGQLSLMGEWQATTLVRRVFVGASLAADTSGRLFAAGYALDTARFGPFMLHRPEGTVFVAAVDLVPAPPPAPCGLAAYPNPVRQTLHLAACDLRTIDLLDDLGRLVRREHRVAGTTETALSVGGLVPGIYAVRAGTLTCRVAVE